MTCVVNKFEYYMHSIRIYVTLPLFSTFLAIYKKKMYILKNVQYMENLMWEEEFFPSCISYKLCFPKYKFVFVYCEK